VSGTPDGSRKVWVSYTGCYVFEWVSDLGASAGTVAAAPALAALTGVALPQDGNYLMLVGLEGTDAAGQRVLHEEKLLRCPVDLPGKALAAPWEALLVSCGDECHSSQVAVPCQFGGWERGPIAVQKTPWRRVWTQGLLVFWGLVPPLQGQQVKVACVS